MPSFPFSHRIHPVWQRNFAGKSKNPLEPAKSSHHNNTKDALSPSFDQVGVLFQSSVKVATSWLFNPPSWSYSQSTLYRATIAFKRVKLIPLFLISSVFLLNNCVSCMFLRNWWKHLQQYTDVIAPPSTVLELLPSICCTVTVLLSAFALFVCTVQWDLFLHQSHPWNTRDYMKRTGGKCRNLTCTS